MTVFMKSDAAWRREVDGLTLYYQSILDSAHEALAVVDSRLHVVVANRRFREIVDMGICDDESLEPRTSLLAHPELSRLLEKSFAGRNGAEEQTLDLNTPALGARKMSVRSQLLTNPKGGSPLSLVVMEDVTDLIEIREQLRQEIAGCHWAKEELLDSGRRFRMLVETMNDGLALRDEHGRLTYVNNRLCEILDFERDEIIGHPVTDFLDEENRAVYAEQISRRERGSHDPYEMKWLRKDGSGVYTLMSPRPVYDAEGRIRGSFAIVTDITARKNIETALRESEKKLRMLSNHLLLAQEQEREHISRELHDELGQDLTVLKYQMRFIQKRLRKDQKVLSDACTDTLQHIDDLVENIRRISRNLSPYNLQQLGLTASIELIATEFSRHASTEVVQAIENIDGLLSQEAERSIYRIFQEALTNIGKHSGATTVWLSVSRKGGAITCSVRDNGTGFSVAEAGSGISQTSGIGLATMEERARMIGGLFEITSRKGEGTRIVLRVPVPEKGKP